MPHPASRLTPIALGALVLTLAACAREAPSKGKPPTVVTVVQAQVQKLELVQEAVGQIESETAPFVAAEIAGRVVKLHADVGQRVRAGQVLAELDTQDQQISQAAAAAEVARVQALLDNQERLVERYRKLVAENFVSQTMLETNESQLAALRAQLAAAQSQQQAAARGLSKARVTAPVAGRIESRAIALGDYVTVGKPLFQIATTDALRVHLPFPETVAAQLKPGLPVRLRTPAADVAVTGRIRELRPMINNESRAVDVIVDVPNTGQWRPGASVNAAVVVGTRPEALLVPELSLVQRPAGEVVYVVQDGKARQRKVQVGQRQGGMAEILAGLRPGETVVVDGAAFLTDNTPVKVQPPKGAGKSDPNAAPSAGEQPPAQAPPQPAGKGTGDRK